MQEKYQEPKGVCLWNIGMRVVLAHVQVVFIQLSVCVSNIYIYDPSAPTKLIYTI
jgi:hypothetical protein